MGSMSPSRLFIQPMKTPTPAARTSTPKIRKTFAKSVITITLKDKHRQVNCVASGLSVKRRL